MPPKTIKLPTPLVDLMQLTLGLLEAGDPSALAEDAIQTDDGFGGLVEPDADVLRFTYFAKENQERWDVVVRADQVKRIANKKMKTLPRLVERPPWQVDIPSGVYVESEAEAQAKLSELETLLKKAGKDGRGEAPARETSEREVNLGALLGAAFDSDAGEDDEPDEEASEEQIDSARRLLKLLLDHEALELKPGGQPEVIARAMVDVIESELRPFAKAQALSNMLFERDDVEEIFVSDDDLAKLLERW